MHEPDEEDGCIPVDMSQQKVFKDEFPSPEEEWDGVWHGDEASRIAFLKMHGNALTMHSDTFQRIAKCGSKAMHRSCIVTRRHPLQAVVQNTDQTLPRTGENLKVP